MLPSGFGLHGGLKAKRGGSKPAVRNVWKVFVLDPAWNARG